MDEMDIDLLESDISGFSDGSPHSPSSGSPDLDLVDLDDDWGSEDDSLFFGHDSPAESASDSGSSNNSDESGSHGPSSSSLGSGLPSSPISLDSSSNPSSPAQQRPPIPDNRSRLGQRHDLDNFFLPEVIHVHNHHHHHHGGGVMFSPPRNAPRRAGQAVPPPALMRNDSLSAGSMSRGARRMNGAGNGESSRRNQADELVEMELERGQEARRQARRQSRRFSGQPPSLPPHGEQTIIDLTAEPDSPVQQFRPLPQQSAAGSSRNPRRQMSLNHRTPSLARSDGSLLVEQHPIIDLTGDSPDEARSPPRNHNHNNHHHQGNGAGRQGQNHRQNNHSQSPDVAFMGIFSRLNEIRALGRIHRALPEIFQGFGGVGRNQPMGFEVHEVQIIGHNHAPQQPMDNPLQGNPVLFNYQANGFGNRAPSPKPAFVPPPAAREGFTRNTGEIGEGMVVVCAGCEEELKYDPDADEDGRPTKKPRTRKDREEHHFWAVTACGHVYCKRCFDNRTSTGKKGGESLSFRPEGKALYCAVDGCESDVKQKRAWVGIFL